MRVLLSTIGSQGDVQPLVALASQLKALGQEAPLCVPPDLHDWIDSLGIPVISIGPEVRKTAAASPRAAPVVIPQSTISTTGHDGYTTSASEPGTHPARRRPIR